ncbi:MAG: hypothetical protein IPK60_22480 [Sandaracinaceae bacterium]|nr:hypothetical protein [Sandaracinaceae bacterium]
MLKRVTLLLSVVGILGISACDRTPAAAPATPAAQQEGVHQQGVPSVHVPAADHGRTPTCTEFIEHMAALIDATGRPNPHFNEGMRPSAIAACERARNLETNAAEARCVMRATSPQALGDCGSGQFMRQW